MHKDNRSRVGWIAVLMITVILIAGQAMAAGNFYIPGSRDKEGGIGRDGQSFDYGYINGIFFEGDTSNGYETNLYATDPTADRVLALPDSSGTLMTTGTATSLTDTTNANMLISNGVVFQSKAISGKVAITNAGVTSLPDTTNTNILISNGVIMQSKTMSGDATIANTGVLTIGNNKIGVAEAFINTVPVTIAASGTSGTATVTALSNIIGHYGVGNIHDIAINGITNITISGTTLTVLINGTAGSNAVVHNVVVLEP